MRMQRRALEVLVCPRCREPLAADGAADPIEEGFLRHVACKLEAPVHNGIPRFHAEAGDVSSFGFQWRRFARTQLDRYNGTTLSRDRLLQGTGWRFEELRGARILEVGCGAGRFTDLLVAAGADVYAMDASGAADVCLENVGRRQNLCVVQARIEDAPFAAGAFDRVLCYGMLQHATDPRTAFQALVPLLRPGGALAIDVYLRSWRPNRWNARHLWRPVTRYLPKPVLFQMVRGYVPAWIDVENRFARVPKLRGLVASVIPCWNYTGTPGLTPQQVKEWAVLDTFDALASWHDQPQTIRAVEGWCHDAGLMEVRVCRGGNGIVATARQPA